MANRRNHYEAAFEAYLRQECIPYVAVDEKRRALVKGTSVNDRTEGQQSLKSLDFIVSPTQDEAPATRWLIDVKGRRFPSGQKQPQYWRNWSTRDDLESLARWQAEFGPQFRAALVFAYELTADRSPVGPEEVYYYGQSAYGFVGIRLDDYLPAARTLSARWGTVSMSVPLFRERARSVLELFGTQVANTL